MSEGLSNVSSVRGTGRNGTQTWVLEVLTAYPSGHCSNLESGKSCLPAASMARRTPRECWRSEWPGLEKSLH